MTLAAQETAGLVVVSLAFIVGGYLFVALLWYVMVLRPGREERRLREASAATAPEDRGGPA